jgi:hypothetical protein
MSRVSLHRAHRPMGCSRQPTIVVVATVATAIVAHVGLGITDLYIRDYVIIRGRQDQSYLRIVSLPLGCGYRHQRRHASWVQGIYQDL